MINLAAVVIIQQHFNRNRTIATAIAMVGASVGQIVGPLLLEWLIQAYGWRGAMLIFGATMLHSVPCAITFTPVTSSSSAAAAAASAPASSSDTDTAASTAAAAAKTDNNNKNSFREMMRRTFDFSILRETPFTLFCLSFFLVKFNVFGFYQHLPSRVQFLGGDKRTAALLMTVTGVLAFVSRFAAGLVGNMRCANRTLMYTVAVTLAGLDTMLLSVSSSFAFATVAAICGVFGACMGKRFQLAIAHTLRKYELRRWYFVAEGI